MDDCSVSRTRAASGSPPRNCAVAAKRMHVVVGRIELQQSVGEILGLGVFSGGQRHSRRQTQGFGRIRVLGGKAAGNAMQGLRAERIGVEAVEPRRERGQKRAGIRLRGNTRPRRFQRCGRVPGGRLQGRNKRQSIDFGGFANLP